MSDHRAQSKAEGRIFAVVTRADGTVEDLGCISSFAACPSCGTALHESEAICPRCAMRLIVERHEKENDGDGL